MSDHYFGGMVGHFGAFSKYGALMIAGKNDDRGATEFYDNLGFKICSSKSLSGSSLNTLSKLLY